MKPRTDRNTALFDDADLVVDRVYEGGRAGNAGDDRLSKLLGVSNQGGFRYLGQLNDPKLVVLVSSLADHDWPDGLDLETGVFTYFGDNKTPGCQLLETKRRGNRLLDRLFAIAHGSAADRRQTPPILVFGSTGFYRDVRFLGLAVPGAETLTSNEDLVAIWRSSEGKRFQNYRATFTILDAPTISRAWLNEAKAGDLHTPAAPTAWRSWVDVRRYKALIAQPTRAWRTKSQQLPQSGDERQLIGAIRKFFNDHPTDFEHCAAALVRMMDERFTEIAVTRASRDGGRDAVGICRIGTGATSIHVEFAVEAKCYAENKAVGVKETSRLISRLRHRQFGFLVTTSYVAEQAYQEIVEDGHPIGILAATDIARLLITRGLSQSDRVLAWLSGFSTEHSLNRNHARTSRVSRKPSESVTDHRVSKRKRDGSA